MLDEALPSPDPYTATSQQLALELCCNLVNGNAMRSRQQQTWLIDVARDIACTSAKAAPQLALTALATMTEAVRSAELEGRDNDSRTIKMSVTRAMKVSSHVHAASKHLSLLAL